MHRIDALSHQPAGICAWLTGLSGAGKTTTARRVIDLLSGTADAMLLDGDEIRKSISRDLGFSRAERELNVARVAALAREAVDRQQIVICSLVSPYRAMRARAREIIGDKQFIEIYVATSLDVCQQRDPKGLYKRALNGQLTGFTGIDDPYEPPLMPDLTLDTVGCSVDDNAKTVVAAIRAAASRLYASL